MKQAGFRLVDDVPRLNTGLHAGRCFIPKYKARGVSMGLCLETPTTENASNLRFMITLITLSPNTDLQPEEKDCAKHSDILLYMYV